ncbi:MAG: ACT domain-containing protein [Clostridia bacterium]|nr:ACT domain-containing protein [Clostridia bacterium]
MRAVVTVVGKDCVGILASVSAVCSECGVNITDVTQSILRDMFVMIMMVELADRSALLADFSGRLQKMGKDKGLRIQVMHEDIFNTMHRI